MSGEDYCTERGKAKEDQAEDGVDEAEEVRADAVGHEANDDGERREPGHQAGGRHHDSKTGGAVAQD